MLQGVRKNEENDSDLSFLTREASALITPGSGLEQAAMRLQNAVLHIEAMVQSIPVRESAPGVPSAMSADEHQNLLTENARLTEWVTQLEEENVRLTDQLVDMRNQNQAVSQQVLSLSTRLEALISRLARLLEE